MNLKDKVKEYWQNNVCGTQEHLTRNPTNLKPISSQAIYSKEYFQELEDYRYSINPEIFEFAQFTRYKDKTILEVGVGAGVDFLQWCRVSKFCCGIDFTPASIEHTHKLLDSNGLQADLRVADAEDLPFPDNQFDLVYSWGVLHHTPSPFLAIKECIRVTRPSGEIKLMLYNRWSLLGLITKFYEVESPGTQAFTKHQIAKILKSMPVQIVSIKARANKYDLLYRYPYPIRLIAYLFNYLTGMNSGFFMTIHLRKEQAR